MGNQAQQVQSQDLQNNKQGKSSNAPLSGKQNSQNAQTRKENQGPSANFPSGSRQVPGPPKYPGQPVPDQKNPSSQADTQNYPNQPRYPNSQVFPDQPEYPSRQGYPNQPRYPNLQPGFNNPQGYPNQLSYYNPPELLNQPVNPNYQEKSNQPGYRDSQVFPNPPYPQGYPNQAGYPKSKGSSDQVNVGNIANSIPTSDNFYRNNELKYPGVPLNPNRLPNQVPMKSQQPSKLEQPGNFNIQLDNQNLDPSRQKSNPLAFDGLPAFKNKPPIPPFPSNPSSSQSDKLNESPDSKPSLLQSLGQTGNVPENEGESPSDRDLGYLDRDAKFPDQLPPPPNVNLPVGMPPPPAY